MARAPSQKAGLTYNKNGFPSGLSWKLPMYQWTKLHRYLIWIYRGAVPSYGNCQYISPHLNAWWIQKGSVKVSSKMGTLHGKKGDWIIPPGGTLRNQSFSPDARILSLQFHAAWPDDLPIFREIPAIRFSAADFPALGQRANRLLGHVRMVIGQAPLELQLHELNPRQYAWIDAAFSDWLIEFIEVMARQGLHPDCPSEVDARVRRLLAEIATAPADLSPADIDIPGLVGLTPGQTDRLFKKHTGRTLHAHLEERRLAAVRQRLQFTSSPFKQIGAELGFKSQTHFCIWFRRLSGATPGEYRQRIRSSPAA